MLYRVRPNRDDTDEVYMNDVSDWVMLSDSITSELKRVSVSEREGIDCSYCINKFYEKYGALITEDAAHIGDIYYKMSYVNLDCGDCIFTIKGFCNQRFRFLYTTINHFSELSYMVVKEDKLLFRFFADVVYSRYLEFTLVTDSHGNFIDFVVPDVCVCTHLFWIFEEKLKYTRLD